MGVAGVGTPSDYWSGIYIYILLGFLMFTIDHLVVLPLALVLQHQFTIDSFIYHLQYIYKKYKV